LDRDETVITARDCFPLRFVVGEFHVSVASVRGARRSDDGGASSIERSSAFSVSAVWRAFLQKKRDYYCAG